MWETGAVRLSEYLIAKSLLLRLIDQIYSAASSSWSRTCVRLMFRCSTVLLTGKSPSAKSSWLLVANDDRAYATSHELNVSFIFGTKTSRQLSIKSTPVSQFLQCFVVLTGGKSRTLHEVLRILARGKLFDAHTANRISESNRIPTLHIHDRPSRNPLRSNPNDMTGNDWQSDRRWRCSQKPFALDRCQFWRFQGTVWRSKDGWADPFDYVRPPKWLSSVVPPEMDFLFWPLSMAEVWRKLSIILAENDLLLQ